MPQDALATLVPGTTHVVVKDSDHNIQLEYPQAVTDAVHQVFNRAGRERQ
jgi:pimeloyl-ACP methyl ester carboxylesterase